MKKKTISLVLVLALMMSLLPHAAAAGFTEPKQLLTPKQLQGTYAPNGITLVDLVTGRKAAATIFLYPDSIAIRSAGKTLTLPLVKVSGSSNEFGFSLDGKIATLELNGGSGRGTLFVNGNGIELFGGVKKVSTCLPAALSRIIFKNTAKAVTCAAVTAAKVASCLAKNVIKTTGNILRSLLKDCTSDDNIEANDGVFTFTGFDDQDWNNGRIEGDWNGVHYQEIGYYDNSPFTEDTVLYLRGGASIFLDDLFIADDFGDPSSDWFGVSANGKYQFDGFNSLRYKG